MQRLSMIAFTATAVLALSGASFKPAPSSTALTASPASSIPAPAPAAQANLNSYYFYSTIDGSYNDYETVSYECWEMEIWYDCTVDQNPGGGTLIEKGYWTNNPNMPVMIFLYAHF